MGADPERKRSHATTAALATALALPSGGGHCAGRGTCDVLLAVWPPGASHSPSDFAGGVRGGTRGGAGSRARALLLLLTLDRGDFFFAWEQRPGLAGPSPSLALGIGLLVGSKTVSLDRGGDAARQLDLVRSGSRR